MKTAPLLLLAGLSACAQSASTPSEPAPDGIGQAAGDIVTLRGKALDAKAGAVVMMGDGEPVYIQGLDRWPEELAGVNIVATGRLKRMKHIPDPVGTGGLIMQGAFGEQLVLENASWAPE